MSSDKTPSYIRPRLANDPHDFAFRVELDYSFVSLICHVNVSCLRHENALWFVEAIDAIRDVE